MCTTTAFALSPMIGTSVLVVGSSGAALFHTSSFALVRQFSTSSFALSLASHLPESIQGTPEKGVKPLEGGTVPRGGGWYETFITHPHDDSFWEQIAAVLRSLAPGEKYAILIQPQFVNGSYVTLDGSFLTDNDPNMSKFRDHFEPLIVKLEDDYNDEFCGETRIKRRNYTDSCNTKKVPSPSRTKAPSQILEAMQQQTGAILESNRAILEAIKLSQPTLNWQPIIQGALTGLAQAFGAQVSFPSPPPTTLSTPPQTPDEIKVLRLEIQEMRQVITQQGQRFEQAITEIAQAQAQQQQANVQMTQAITQLTQVITQAIGQTSSNNGSKNSNGFTPPSSPSDSSAAPATPVSKKSPPAAPAAPKSSLPEITTLDSYKGDFNLNQIVTADLESIISQGNNKVFMAAWYNGTKSMIFDITSYNYNSETMLQEFWLNLINNNQGATLYFHNWAGYDAILSLLPLIGLHGHYGHLLFWLPHYPTTLEGAVGSRAC